VNTALIYIATSIALALIFGVIKFVPDKPRSNPGIYAYPRKMIWLVFAGIPLLIVIELLVVAVSPAKSWRFPLASGAIGIAFLLMYIYAYIYIRCYFVRLAGNEMRYGSIPFHRSLRLDSVRRFVVIEDAKGGKCLELYDGSNHRIFKVADTIQDFGDLVVDVREQLPKHGIAYESRDKWGEWTRHTS
jgi:hypothetical protein